MDIPVPPADHHLSEPTFYAVAVLLAFLAYLLVFQMTSGGSPLDNAVSALTSLVPLVALGSVARAFVMGLLIGRSPIAQLAAHIPLALLFSMIWYWSVIVLIGLSSGQSPLRFNVEPFFPTPAIAWQLLQGISFYSLIAATAYRRAKPAMPSFIVTEPVAQAAEGSTPALSRYFIRQGEDIHPVDISQIVTITGADDYAEVVTRNGRHLVRMTLSEFEAVLQEGKFIRVHRSRIVNIDRIERAEPAGGGRMLLHMDNGEVIQASRTGSKLLRDRVL